MGISFDRNARVAGYRVSIFRNAFRGYIRTRKTGRVIDLQGVFDQRRDGAIVYEELLDRGLIDRVHGRVTEAGNVLIRSKVVARSPLKKAQMVLEAFLDRAHQLDRDPEAISRGEQIRLFGSLLRGEATVGDVDLAVTSSRSRKFSSLGPQVEHAKLWLADTSGVPNDWRWEWDRVDWLYDRAIFGTRRHPLLAGVRHGLNDLMAVAATCKLIYDRTHSGRVDDAIVPGSANRTSSLPR